MLSRRRITIALIALIVLVLGGWLATEVFGDDGVPDSSMPATTATAAWVDPRGGDMSGEVGMPRVPQFQGARS
ncbi:hypothetical protein [Haloechinothrix sp. LS1_15]|uniref:hypothetical protein n=1 Tax=Haloechinothrix sp. LS1_15 TaxID=2652248 RepID=UPI00294B2F2E|nr:hypothetical protein [Haloechinothrix sp. LS1_15]